MRRRPLNVLTVLSLLLGALLFVAWLSSTESLTVLSWKPTSPVATVRWELHSIGGRVALLRCSTDAGPTWRGGGRFGVGGLRGIPSVIIERDFIPAGDAGVAGFAFWWVTRSGDVPSGSRGVVMVPYWALALPFAVAPALSLRGSIRRKQQARRRRAARCPACGYDLRGTPGRCPECGTFATVGTDV
jgi:hypothetical protein